MQLDFLLKLRIESMPSFGGNKRNCIKKKDGIRSNRGSFDMDDLTPSYQCICVSLDPGTSVLAHL